VKYFYPFWVLSFDRQLTKHGIQKRRSFPKFHMEFTELSHMRFVIGENSNRVLQAVRQTTIPSFRVVSEGMYVFLTTAVLGQILLCLYSTPRWLESEATDLKRLFLDPSKKRLFDTSKVLMVMAHATREQFWREGIRVRVNFLDSVSGLSEAVTPMPSCRNRGLGTSSSGASAWNDQYTKVDHLLYA